MSRYVVPGTDVDFDPDASPLEDELKDDKEDNSGFKIHGAPEFSRYLRENITGKLTFRGPMISDKSFVYSILVDGERIGRFSRRMDPDGDFSDPCESQYSGIIPGYNEVEVNGEKGLAQVWLIYSNRRSEQVDKALVGHLPPNATDKDLEKVEKEVVYRTGRPTPTLIRTPWQRQDKHEGVPFP